MAKHSVSLRVEPTTLARAEALIPYFQSLPFAEALAGRGGITQPAVLRVAVQYGLERLETEARKAGVPLVTAGDPRDYPTDDPNDDSGEALVHGPDDMGTIHKDDVLPEFVPATEAEAEADDFAERKAAAVRAGYHYRMSGENEGWFTPPPYRLGPFARLDRAERAHTTRVWFAELDWPDAADKALLVGFHYKPNVGWFTPVDNGPHGSLEQAVATQAAMEDSP